MTFEKFPGYSIMFCQQCGTFKKFAPADLNAIETFGLCNVSSPMHEVVYKREIFCPYESIM